MRTSSSRTVGFAAIAVAAVVVVLAGVTGCSVVAPTAGSIPPAASKESTVTTGTNLGTVEVRQYKGKKLDAVGSEPENSIKGPQHIDISTYRLKISGLVATPTALTYEQVLAMPAYQKATTLNCVEGWSVTYLWQGVRIKDLLEKAGYDPNAKIVIFRCYDGYSTSLPLDYVLNNDILLAYKMNGIAIPPERGFPFQVVAEDVWGYKWAKWVTDIQVSNDTTFRGYWESRGYDNSATLPGK